MEQIDLDLLQIAPPYHLQAVIRARNLPLSPKFPLEGAAGNGQPDAATTAEIARYLFAPSAIRAILERLDDLEQRILWELVACGGRTNSRDLALYLTNTGQLAATNEPESTPRQEPFGIAPEQTRTNQIGSPPQYPMSHPHGVFELSVRHMLVLGLLFWGRQTNFAGRDYTSGLHDGVLIVPHAVRAVVKETLQLEQHTLSQETDNEQDVGEGARQFQRVLYRYWALVSTLREGLSLVSSGMLSRAALRAVSEQFLGRNTTEQIRSEMDMPQLLFVRLLLMKAGLLHERRGSLYAAPSEGFFALPLQERAHRCYLLYRDQHFWNEMAFLPEVNVRPGPAPLEAAHEEVIHGRQVVIERLRHETLEEWHELPTFIARTKLYAPYLLFPRQYGPRAERYSSSSNPYGWDFRLRRGWLTHREGWHMVEGGFIRAVIGGPLHWLGIVETEREEQPNTFRIPPGAQAILEEGTSNEEIPWGRLIVQPNFELVALAPVSELLLIRLDRFAERVSLEHIAQYRLTRASVTRAIQTGLRADMIRAELEEAAGGEIPQNVQYSLIEWERQARRVELWQGSTLLEVHDEALLERLMTDDATRLLFGRRLSPRLIEVAPQQLKAVQQLLWQNGYLPALTQAPDVAEGQQQLESTPEPQWLLHPDGLLEPVYSVVDLYLTAELLRFSELDEPSGYQRITASSLRRGQENGVELLAIINFLQQHCAQGIPGSFVLRLKLWGGGYSQQPEIQVEHAPLLCLPPQVLHDLQHDEEIQTLLGAEIQQPSSIIRVPADNLQQVLALLRERGFTPS